MDGVIFVPWVETFYMRARRRGLWLELGDEDGQPLRRVGGDLMAAFFFLFFGAVFAGMNC